MLITGSLALANIACTRVVRVPIDAYDQAEVESHRQWRVRTHQGRIYAVARFTVTDSTLVINEFDPLVGPGRGVKNVPHILALEEVASIEKVKYTEPWNTIALVSVIVVVGTAVYLAIVLSRLNLN